MEWWPRRWGTSSRGKIGIMVKDGEIRCALCRGRGVLRSAKARCPACGGRGFVEVAPPALICAYCNGRGEAPARSGISCTVCGGKGVVTVRQPIEVCPDCRGTGAAPQSRLPCLMCQGKGVVAARRHREATGKGGGDDSGRIAARARHPTPEEIKTTEGRAGGHEIQVEAEPSPISLLPRGYEVGEGGEADYLGQPEHRKETRTGSPVSISGLVRRLMAAERARILGRKAVNLERYTLEKRSQRWRESRKPFK